MKKQKLPKYVLRYAKDCDAPRSPDNTETVEFRTYLGFLWYFLGSKAARAAVRADRFQFFTIEDK